MTNTISERIEELRDYMRKEKVDAVIIPSTDAHLSEYLPKYWESRKWISGFTGSAGTVVVTKNKAGLWTDSRYFLQAEEELKYSGIDLYKERIPGAISIIDWLLDKLSASDVVGIDGRVFAANAAMNLQSELKKNGILLNSSFYPFDSIWPDRPSLPVNKAVCFPEKYSGESAGSKISRILDELHKTGADSAWISTLDTIAWLYNIRGNDVPFNPVVVSYAFISDNKRILFIDKNKVDNELSKYFDSRNITVMPYEMVNDFLSEICNMSVCVDSARISYSIYKAIEKRNCVEDRIGFIDMFKSIKNNVEIEGYRHAVLKDGIALTRFMIWFEDALPHKTMTEFEVARKINAFRAEQEGFMGDSFDSIVSYNSNAAIVHYHPTARKSSVIGREGLLLMDTGGQYLYGTTDITRTISLGNPSDDMKRDFTIALKGNIELSRAVFPAGTRGVQIDALARKCMWENGINYLHGTGHGIGHYLNVHEGPQSIRMEENPVKLHSGMVMSNEPGIYRDHKYGVRTENIMLIKPAMTTEYGDFYCLEALTLFPVDTSLVIVEMLSGNDRKWLNDYHQTVYEKLEPHLNTSEKEWLKDKTKAI